MKEIPKFKQVYDNKWYELTNPHFIKCCDCSLVHRLAFKIDDKGNLVFKSRRMVGETKKNRKLKKYEALNSLLKRI